MFRKSHVTTALFVSVALSAVACGSDIQMGTDEIGDKVTAAGGGGGADASSTAGDRGFAGSGQGGFAGSTEIGGDLERPLPALAPRQRTVDDYH